MTNRKKTFIIDDGFNAELVESATFCGLFEIPLIKRPSTFIIPSAIIPFSQRHKTKDFSEFVAFYEHDVHFAEILISAKKLLPEMKKFAGIISPDCSLYRDMPLAIQIINNIPQQADRSLFTVARLLCHSKYSLGR